jgi:polyhydroxyalkanoate synthesis repressor PhaR
MAKLRLIKKYPNRRLYDTQTSSYITLADVKELVLKQETFQVVDAKSNDDLTRSILLQIILEEENTGAPMFSHDVLTQFIRFYGNAMQGVMGSYLEKNVNAFLEIQKNIQEQSKAMFGADTSKVSQDLWGQFMNFQGPATAGGLRLARLPEGTGRLRTHPDALRAEGYDDRAGTYEDANLVVVNTCGFIDEAVDESLDAIGEALAENGKVIVTGCLGAKGDVITERHPTVLAVTGPHAPTR